MKQPCQYHILANDLIFHYFFSWTIISDKGIVKYNTIIVYWCISRYSEDYQYSAVS